MIASESTQPPKVFPPPEVPPDFIPVHRFNPVSCTHDASGSRGSEPVPGAVSALGSNTIQNRRSATPAPAQMAQLSVDQLLALAKGKFLQRQPVAAEPVQDRGSRGHTSLTAKERSEILGEAQLPVRSRPKASEVGVSDGIGGSGGIQTYAERAEAASRASGMSLEHTAHVQSMLGSRFARAGQSGSVGDGGSRGGNASDGSGDFKPFVLDPAKQSRYERFLEHRNSERLMGECRALGMQVILQKAGT